MGGVRSRDHGVVIISHSLAVVAMAAALAAAAAAVFCFVVVCLFFMIDSVPLFPPFLFCAP